MAGKGEKFVALMVTSVKDLKLMPHEAIQSSYLLIIVYSRVLFPHVKEGISVEPNETYF